MMRFNDVSFAVFYASGLNDIGINRALRQPLHITELLRLSIEDFDKSMTNDFALLLRVDFTRELT